MLKQGLSNKTKGIMKGRFPIRGKLMMLCLSLLLVPSVIVSVLSYQAATDALNHNGEVILKNNVKSTIQLIAMLDAQVKAGVVEKAGAEEFVRMTMLGPKGEDGKRPINKAIDLGESGYPFIIDDNGLTLAHPSMEGTSLDGLENNKGELVLDTVNHLPVTDAFVETAKSGGGFVYYDWQLPGQTDKYASKVTYIEKDPNWGWNIAAGTYMQDFNSGASKIIKVTIITLIITSLLGVAAASLFTIRLTKPIKQVSQRASEVAKGNLKLEPIVCKSGDELEALAGSFNEMVVQLKGLVVEVGRSVDQVAASSEELMASGEQTSQASEHIANTVQQVAEGAEKQSSSAEESYQVIHDMSASIQQIASSTEQASHAAKYTSERATAGNDTLEQAVTQMESIQQSFNSLAVAVRGLGARSHEIGRMVQVITDISAQTNLLALNASIEAARAGEHGKGFAVVAGEVRKLAEQTKASSGQIATVIHAIGIETEQVVKAMDEAGEVVTHGIVVVENAGEMFDSIRVEVLQVAQQIDEVSVAAGSIAAGTEQVMQSIKEVARVAVEGASGSQSVAAAAQEQTASMEEIAAASTMLARMAEDLQLQINRFQV